MDRLNRQVQETQKLLSNPDADWKDCSSTIEELATAIESLGHDVNRQDVVRLLLRLSVGIGMQLTSIRSKLVKDVCEGLLRIVKALGQDFADMANAILPQIVATAKSTSGAIRQPGSKLLSKLSEVVRYDLSLMRKIYEQLMQDKARMLVLEQLRIIFVYWSDEEVQPYEADVLEIIRRGLEDQNENVRKMARDVLIRVSSRWIEQVDELVDMPSTQSKTLIISEHRDSPLAEAILNKFPELADKSDSFSRSRSFMQQSRASYRKSPRHKREQNIEIHLPTTPTPKQPAEQEVLIEQERSNDATRYTRRTAAVPESTERESISRQLFDNPEFSTWPDGQQDDILGVFDEKHGPNAETVEPLSPISSPPAALPSQATVARSSNVSSIEEVSPQHPTVRQLMDSKIPSPSNRSPSFFNKKRLESPTRATRSPELRPSLLPRPGSFTLKASGSSGPSTPVGSAKFEENENETEINLLSASDEYFSKQIPSSFATPTPPPSSTDNVTFRTRRRTFSRQEHEDLRTYQPELSSPELPAPEEVIHLQQVETTPESSLRRTLLGEDIAPPLREQHYADDVSDNADDTGFLPDGSDHVEFDNEWSQRRLDDSQARGDGDNLAEGEDVERSKSSILPSDNDIFPDEWRLDDGPRYKFDHEDEIDHLSDDHDQCDFVVGVDDSTSSKEVNVSDTVTRHEFAESSPQEYFTMRTDYEDEETVEEDELTAEVKVPNDALTGLLNVRDEMNRLRAITRNEDNSNLPFKERHESFERCGANTEERSIATHTEQNWGEPAKKEPSYLERLTHADRFARSPLLADTPSKEMDAFIERVSPLHKSELLRTTASVDEHEQSEDNEFLTIQTQSSSPLQIDQVTAKSKPESFDFVKASRSYSPCLSSNINAKEIAQDQESHTAHEQAERFDAAEKLFAAKEVMSVQNCYAQQPKRESYMRPQSPTQEQYSGPLQQRYPPPTPMGAKLTSTFANTQRNVLGEDIDDAKNAAGDDNNGDNGEKENSLKPSLEQTAKHTSFQPVPSCVETVLPTTTNSKRENDPAPPTDIPERNLPPTNLSWGCSLGITTVMFLAAMFCIAGILHAAKTVHDSHEYHLDLKARIDKFEAGIAESHMKVMKLEEEYAIWSEYVRKLTEEDEMNALSQLQAIQVEVQKWQQDMKEDLVQFRQALSVDSIEAAFANLRVNNTKPAEQ